MPAAYLPSPSRVLWRVGPVGVNGYALCVVLGIVAALWVAERRYRAAGGRPGLPWDLASVAVPAGLIGARLYRVGTDYHRYFGSGRDWVNVLRIWEGGLGLPGALLASAIACWVWCRCARVRTGPVLAAAVPGLALAAAIGRCGDWFAQQMYGAPSSWPWAVEISPWDRALGYQSFAAFQPLFLYEALWDLAVAALVAAIIRRFQLTGDRALALFAALYAAGRFWAQALLVGPAPHVAGVREDQAAVLAIFAAAAGYLYLTRARRGPEPLLAGPARPASASLASMAEPAGASRTAAESARLPAGPGEAAGPGGDGR
jgi:prolipoprotein diacylglyceryl transferase